MKRSQQEQWFGGLAKTQISASLLAKVADAAKSGLMSERV